MEVDQNQPTKQSSTTTTIWRMFLDLFDVRNIPVFCNPMLDTFDTKTLDLVENLPEQHPYDDKCIEMGLLHTNKEQNNIFHKIK
jgi:hypothetical protein